MGNDTDAVRVRIRITGLVQGVGYRYYTYDAANRLGLTGWVRNRADGSVEAEAQGGRDAVTRFLSQLRRGPRWARVRNVDVTPIKLQYEQSTNGFRVRPDDRA